MKLLVDGQQYDNLQLLAMGGEGELYPLKSDLLAKVYFSDKRSPQRKRKVLALCDSFDTHFAGADDSGIAFPRSPAYQGKERFSDLAGFSMTWFKNLPTLEELSYDLTCNEFPTHGGFSFTDDSAVAFVYSTFSIVQQLHRARVVLGDINPRNILVDIAAPSPVIVDIDAAQIGGFGCETYHPNYVDPLLDTTARGVTGGLQVDTSTDLYSLASVAFEFLVGVRPHFLYVNPTLSEEEKRVRGVSILHCIEKGDDYLSSLSLDYFDCPENTAIRNRVLQVKSLNADLYKFFASVFVNGERDSLLSHLPITDPRNPGNIFLVESGFKRVIDHEAVRRRREAAQARQGRRKSTVTVPDSGFRKIISKLGTSRTAPQTASTVGPSLDAELPEAEFASFLARFDLQLAV